MQNFRREYHDEMNRVQVPPELVEKTRQAMHRKSQKSKKPLRWAVILPTAAAVMMTSATVLAYNVTGSFQSPWYHSRMEAAENLPEQAVNSIQNTDEHDNLSVTVTSVAGDENTTFLNFTVKTLDGSPLQELTELRRSDLAAAGFEKAWLHCDGYYYYLSDFRIDTAETPNQATFEALVGHATTDGGSYQEAPRNLVGKTGTLILENYQDFIYSCEDVGFLFENVGELYNQMISEPSENFIKTGNYAVYADNLSAPSYTIPAGNQHIQFSNQFPNSYIDNIGFQQSGDLECQRDWLYISIVPGSEEDAEKLKHLAFQNIDTGEMLWGENIYGECLGPDDEESVQELQKKREMNGGRIVLALSRFGDGSWTMEEQLLDLTVEDLSHYRLVYNIQCEEKLLAEGKWEIPVSMDYENMFKTITPNQTLETSTGIWNIEKITVRTFSCEMYGSFQGDSAKNLFGGSVLFVMKDGTEIPLGMKMSGSCRKGAFDLHWTLTTPIDLDQIESIKIADNIIPFS